MAQRAAAMVVRTDDHRSKVVEKLQRARLQPLAPGAGSRAVPRIDDTYADTSLRQSARKRQTGRAGSYD
jgi:hypothetical protein